MTLVLELPDNKEAALKFKALAHGVSVAQYVKRILDHDLEQPASSEVEAAQEKRHISDVTAELMRDVPAEELAMMPKDEASEHDHYIYGWPKRNP
jgi:plasmid stability protein